MWDWGFPVGEGPSEKNSGALSFFRGNIEDPAHPDFLEDE